MTQQRLAELLAEFEQSRDVAADTMCDGMDVQDWADIWLGQIKTVHKAAFAKAKQAARRYLIARDFNEFDPGKADLLWKLKYGGAV